MADTTSKAIIAAAKDADLRERAIAIAAKLGVPYPASFIDQNLFELASKDVDGDGNTVASVFEYAQAVYEQEAAKLTAPGKNMSAVTDAHLEYAISALRSDAESKIRE